MGLVKDMHCLCPVKGNAIDLSAESNNFFISLPNYLNGSPQISRVERF